MLPCGMWLCGCAGYGCGNVWNVAGDTLGYGFGIVWDIWLGENFGYGCETLWDVAGGTSSV